MKTDPLFQIFSRRLTDHSNMNESFHEFIHNVVCDYLLHLYGVGFIPQKLELDIEEDLKAEVLEMLRKKTYGFFDLKSYRQSQSKQSSNRAS